MAPNFQSSFIPKEPVTTTGFQKKPTGIFGMLAVSLFAISIIASVGLFVYKGMVRGSIESLKTQLGDAEQNIDKNTINEMWTFSKKLNVVKEIINKHQVVSNVLSIIASSTVSSVYFTDFSYNSTVPGSLSVILRGRAQNYGSIALQESILSQNKYFKSISFGNLGLIEGGSVSFDLTISVDPQASIYVSNTAAVSNAVAETAIAEDITTGLEDIEELDLDELDTNLPDL